jgi:hypothetical protein
VSRSRQGSRSRCRRHFSGSSSVIVNNLSVRAPVTSTLGAVILMACSHVNGAGGLRSNSRRIAALASMAERRSSCRPLKLAGASVKSRNRFYSFRYHYPNARAAEDAEYWVPLHAADLAALIRRAGTFRRAPVGSAWAVP